jgi:DNA-binding CsgD family transcriptional regulator
MNTVIDESNPKLATPKTLQSFSSEVVVALDDQLPIFVKEVMENQIDGILILTEQGKVIYANSLAYQLCHHLSQDIQDLDTVPQPIWHICAALIDSRTVFPDYLWIIDDKIESEHTKLRIRARWMDVSGIPYPCLMVTLEDQNQSRKNLALAEAHRYRLTSREAEVWLLRRSNLTYKAIAAELHIALDTVKKHLKSIYAKRDAFDWRNE